MKPVVGLGSAVPSVKPLVEVTGQVRYTAIKINPQQFTKGKLSLYDQSGQYSLGFHGRTFKMFQLSQNIQNLSTRVGHITIVLANGFQIIAKDCAEESIKSLELCLRDIKHFGSVKSWPSKSGRKFPISNGDKDKSLESSRKVTMKVKKLSPLSSQRGSSGVGSPRLETPSKKSLLSRNQIDRVKGRLLESPLGKKENKTGKDALDFQSFSPISIDNKEVSSSTEPKPSGSWSRPPGEKRTHSPGLRYGCSPSSSPLGFSGNRSKSPKLRKRLLDHTSFCSKENDSYLDKFDEEKSWPSSASKSPNFMKRTYGCRKSASPSPLRPKILQEDNQNSTQHVYSEKDPAHKVSSFYGTSRPSLLPSLTGDKKKFQYFNWKGKGLKRLLPDTSQQQDYRTSSFGDKTIVEGQIKQTGFTGFANLGNTCYMNAILQCLLGTPVFAHDLSNPVLLKNVTQHSLYRYLHTLEIAKRSNDTPSKQQIILRNVKRVISNQAERFSGYLQHDAHEFLGQCLDQLKDDIIKTIPSSDDADVDLAKVNAAERKAREAACPVARNFECQVTHNIICDKCENQITKEEVFYDFSLDIPEINENTNPDDKDIQELLQEYFKEEKIGYKCEKCAFENAHLSHHISSLPRVVILHLKRYELNDSYSKYKKKLDTVDVPLEIDLGALCNGKTKNPLHFDTTPKGGFKRQISNETPDDMSDFQPGLKVRRKLSLPATPILSDSDDTEAGLTFRKDIEKATRLSLDSATEEEQLEWALNESMKSEQQPMNNKFVMSNDHMQSNVLEIDLLSGDENKTNNTKFTDVCSKTNTSKTFTGLRERNKMANVSERDCERNDVVKITELPEHLIINDKATENTDDSVSMEGISEFENEEYQLKYALELSLKEYSKQSAEKEKLKQKMKSDENMTRTFAKRKQNVPTDVNAISRKYRLICVVSHIGDCSFTGHYISDVFDCKECEWKSYNDSTVSKVSEYEVRYGRKQSAYIFFYIDKECFDLITNK